MFSNVLVSVNDHEGGRDAIALARRLLAPEGELTLAHVFRDARGPHRSRAPRIAGEREHARELLERAASEAGARADIRWHGAASVGRGLHELAELAEADLLVVGSSSRGRLGRAAAGDGACAALNGAPCAIAIAPIGYNSDSPSLIREIGVGYDGSPESEHALGVARGLATELGSKLSALEAVSIPASIYLGAPARVRASAINRVLAIARDKIAALGGVEPHAAYGDPIEELTLYSASLDLLVVGSRSYGPFGRLVHGSTAEHLAGAARCPLLVLTRAGRNASIPAGSEDRRLKTSTAA
jgi:nucleotide-binding universal stress UspA family protein